jgi:hypothetical protein
MNDLKHVPQSTILCYGAPQSSLLGVTLCCAFSPASANCAKIVLNQHVLTFLRPILMCRVTVVSTVGDALRLSSLLFRKSLKFPSWTILDFYSTYCVSFLPYFCDYRSLGSVSTLTRRIITFFQIMSSIFNLKIIIISIIYCNIVI